MSCRYCFRTTVDPHEHHRHYYFFKRRISSTFTNAVDGAFDLSCTSLYRGNAVSDRQTKIVMTVNANSDRACRRLPLRERFSQVPQIRSAMRIANRIRDVKYGCTRIDRGLKYFTKKFDIAPGRIFGGKLDLFCQSAASATALRVISITSVPSFF